MKSLNRQHIIYFIIGTLLELFYTWQLMQVQHICETPIILFGQIWTGLIAWLQTEVWAKQFFTSHDLHNIFQLNSVPEVNEFTAIALSWSMSASIIPSIDSN